MKKASKYGKEKHSDTWHAESKNDKESIGEKPMLLYLHNSDLVITNCGLTLNHKMVT
jgi:hypothetical protein